MKTFILWVAAGFLTAAMTTGSVGGLYYLHSLRVESARPQVSTEKGPICIVLPAMVIYGSPKL